MITLTLEQENFITTLPAEVREAVRQQLIDANKAASETRLRKVRKSDKPVKPVYYVNEVLAIDDTLRTKLELISLASEYLVPGVLESAKSKYSEDFDKYIKENPLNMMHIIAATGVKDWRAERDVGGKMQQLLKTLNPTKPESEEDEDVEDGDFIEDTGE